MQKPLHEQLLPVTLLVPETVNNFQKGSDAAFKTLKDICQIVKKHFQYPDSFGLRNIRQITTTQKNVAPQ